MSGPAAVPQPDAHPLDVWSYAFVAMCRQQHIAPPIAAATEAEQSVAAAARFALHVLRSSRWLRRRFPRALSAGEQGRYVGWLRTRGKKRFDLSPAALKNIDSVFANSLGQRIREIYLRDPELQRIYPLALSSLGQRGFVHWLSTHGRQDQQVRDEEILWFLHESTEQPAHGLGLTYLLSPVWQAQFPAALTQHGWKSFVAQALHKAPAAVHFRSLGRRPASMLSDAQHRYLRDPREQQSTLVGVNFLSHFCYPSGIQQAALFAKTALERCGLTTSCRDVPVALRAELLPRKDWLGLEIFPFTIINVAPTPYYATAYERSGLLRRGGVYRIAYWAWELESIPDEWLTLPNLPDEIWAPTPFVAAAMRSRMPVPVIEMLPGVEVSSVETVTRKSLGIPTNHFVFLFMFDMYSEIERKNPLAVIRAFRQAFRPNEPATLLIKVSRGSADPRGLTRLKSAARAADVRLVDEVVSREKAYGFLAMCDCFVSLHRSEGFGLGLAEAMLLGRPAIGTAYSGNLAFMSATNSFLVEHKLVTIERSGPIYRAGSSWAEPSIDDAARQMRFVFENQEQARQVAARGQAELREKLSLEAAGERMIARLREINAQQ